MAIPPRFLEEIRARVSVSEIVGRSVKLTRAGREFKGCCPFHNEKTPSFTVNDDKQFYHCFGCGAHGDVVNFLQQNNNLSFVEAVETLAAQAGLQMPKSTPEEIEKAKKAKDLYDLMEVATIFFQKCLNDAANRDVMDYAIERGLGQKEQETFKIGYAPADRQALRKHLLAEGFSDKDMIEAGVTKESTKGGDPYAFFNDRLMFPVTDRRGRVVAFGGRAFPEHMRPPTQSNFKPPKYINSGDTALFDKGRIVYALSHARQAAGEGKPIIVTEGYMDVIACHKAGFTGAVAPMGTALTEDQINLIWKTIPADEKLPILCFDGDNAGRQAAARALERIMPLLKPNQSVRFAFMPEGKDPDDLIKESGKKAMQDLLDQAMPLINFLWFVNTNEKDFSTPEARAGLTKTLNEAVASITDQTVQTHYRELIKQKISQAFFTRPQNRPYGKPMPKTPSLKPRRPVFGEFAPKALLATVINHPHIFPEFEEDISYLQFADARLNGLMSEIISVLSSQDLDAEGLRAHLINKGFEKEGDDICHESVYIHAAFAAPGYDSDKVATKWSEFFQSFRGKTLNEEIKMGWHKALESANQDDEQALSALISKKTQ